MDRDEILFQRLRASGVPETEADQIAKGYAPRADAGDVDADRLAKAMADLAAAQAAPSVSEEQMQKALTEAGNVVDAVTRGADALLEEVRTQNAVLAKGVLALGAEVQRLVDVLGNQEGLLAKGFDAVARELGTPQAPRSTDATVIPAPGDAAGSTKLGSVLQKAMAELGVTTDRVRKGDLANAVSLLTSGAKPEDVAVRYGLQG